MRINRGWTVALAAGCICVAMLAPGLTAAQRGPAGAGGGAALLPGSRWRVNDERRPEPKVVEPGTASTPAEPGRAPSDAVVLFDGTNLEHWVSARDGRAAPWKIVDGAIEVASGSGDIRSREAFGDCQIHVEFREPTEVRGDSQNRGNSGVKIMERYEIQVLDTWKNPTYADGTLGAIYGQYPPLVNAARKPGEWQSHDIIFEAPRFKDGKLERPAYATVLTNGVLVQNHRRLIGTTTHQALGRYEAHADALPLLLQDHQCAVRYRNIWVRRLDLSEPELPLAQLPAPGAASE